MEMLAPNDRNSRLTLSPTSMAMVATVVAAAIPSATAAKLSSLRRRRRTRDSRMILTSIGILDFGFWIEDQDPILSAFGFQSKRENPKRQNPKSLPTVFSSIQNPKSKIQNFNERPPPLPPAPFPK